MKIRTTVTLDIWYDDAENTDQTSEAAEDAINSAMGMGLFHNDDLVIDTWDIKIKSTIVKKS